jgi:limonene-1,2-epoxide hydrolase
MIKHVATKGEGMGMSTYGLMVLSLLAAPASAAMPTPAEVVAHHVAAMKKADVAAIMSDYATDVVVITPQGLVSTQRPSTGPGVFSGAANARAVFVTLTGKNSIAGIRAMTTRVEPLGRDVALLHWVQFRGTPRQVSGEDVFVIRNGKIVVQNIIVDKPEH